MSSRRSSSWRVVCTPGGTHPRASAAGASLGVVRILGTDPDITSLLERHIDYANVRAGVNIIATTRQVVFGLIDDATAVPTYQWLPQEANEVPCFVVGRPDVDEGDQRAIASIEVPVYVIGRTAASRDDDTQRELDQLADALVNLLWKPPKTEAMTLRLTTMRAMVITIAATEYPGLPRHRRGEHDLLLEERQQWPAAEVFNIEEGKFALVPSVGDSDSGDWQAPGGETLATVALSDYSTAGDGIDFSCQVTSGAINASPNTSPEDDAGHVL